MATSPIEDIDIHDLEHTYLKKIRILSEYAWAHECDEPVVRRWLDCFNGRSGIDEQVERIHALHLLSNFLYFGLDEIRELLRALYRDIFQYGVVEKLRKDNKDCSNQDFIRREYLRELKSTRFLPLGNPSESSSHLLYYFRQVNDLPSNLFAYVHDILDDAYRAKHRVARCIFLDDLAGTGHQAVQYSEVASRLHAAHKPMKISYYTMMATPEAMAAIEKSSHFDEARCVVDLTDELRAFSDGALHYADMAEEEKEIISKITMCKVARVYGKMLSPEAPFGYGLGQLMVGFAHNVPDNTLPIFSSTADSWYAPFPRRIKWSYR